MYSREKDKEQVGLWLLPDSQTISSYCDKTERLDTQTLLEIPIKQLQAELFC